MYELSRSFYQQFIGDFDSGDKSIPSRAIADYEGTIPLTYVYFNSTEGRCKSAIHSS